ncbi:cytochrome P450 [Daldinia sp. FL1419]|nr:cytochrome P450 [Daldinia sp. FL1419]
MLGELIYSSIGLVLLAYILNYVFSLADDTQEPKRINPKVPLIGHAIGMAKYGPSYFTNTSRTVDAEIYTLPILNTKVYVNNSLRLMPLIQKASKTISFRPFIEISAQKIAGNTYAGAKLFDGPLVDDFDHILKKTLAPGPWLDEQNLRTGQVAVAHVDDLVNGGKGKRMWLQEWARHVIVQASSSGVFGKEHPFLDPVVEGKFWEMQKYIPLRLVNLDLFDGAGKAREVIVRALLKYCAAPPADAARTFYERQRVLREGGMSFEDATKQEVSLAIALFGSTSATMFWIIWELFSRLELLAEVREEIETQAVSRRESDEKGRAHGGAEFVLDVAALKIRCPLLLSFVQETQRTRHVHANVRMVLEDTLLDDGKYLLRKGNYLVIPGSPIHADANVWGESVGTFDPYRFLGGEGKTNRKGVIVNDTMVPPSGFLAWGVPPHLCPARQFAATEVLIIVALLAMRVELIPVANNGRWEKTPALKHSELVAIFNPAEDKEMYAKPRAQAVGKWTLKMGESMTRVPIASG